MTGPIPKPTAKFLRTVLVYEHFADHFGLQAEPQALEKQFIYESFGIKGLRKWFGDEAAEAFNPNANYYAVGKRWKEWQINEWYADMRPDQKPLIWAWEIYEDYKDRPHLLNMLDSALYPQLSRFQQDLVDDWRAGQIL